MIDPCLHYDLGPPSLIGRIGVVLETISVWVCINCVVPVLSVPAAVGVARFMTVRRPWIEVIRDGQLYFYCLTLLAATISDMAGKPNFHGRSLFWINVLLAFVPFGLFMLASVAVAQGGPNQDAISRRVALTSSTLAIICTVIVVWSRYQFGLSK